MSGRGRLCYAGRAVFRHAPPDYLCPFCVVIGGGDNRAPYSTQSDVVFCGAHATAFISARWWPNNPGHVLVVPNVHVENMYELVPELSVHVHEAARQVAIAFKSVYRCDGVSTRQHNEPAGDQEVWHYHLHVFPRHSGDRLYTVSDQHRLTTAEERAPYAERLRAHLAAEAR